MALVQLPTEVVENICRYLGTRQTEDVIGPTSLITNNSQLLYARTSHDASIRYGLRLKPLRIALDDRGLCHLLTLSKISNLRDQIIEITFHTLGLHESTGKSRLSGLHDVQAKWIILQEESHHYISSSDIVFLLSECFQNLHSAGKLKTLQIEHGPSYRYSAGPCYTAVLTALLHAQFPLQTMVLDCHIQTLADVTYGGALSQSSSTFMFLVRHVSIRERRSNNYCSTKSYKVSTNGWLENRVQEVSETDLHCPLSALSTLPAALPNIKALELATYQMTIGVGPPPTRTCGADLVAILPNVENFTHLTSLGLQGLDIRSSHLQQLLERLANTILTVVLTGTTLTDGSWHSIVKALLKVANLSILGLTEPLYQCETADCPEHLPEALQWSNNNHLRIALTITGEKTIRWTLRMLALHLRTKPKVPGSDDAGPHQMELFRPKPPILVIYGGTVEVRQIPGDTPP
ncbi:hypothetical protein J1614_009729 [Plenodomus biglobosus]|nr:hypothetical protein J1614_009729 [Plenodomus biglobosus]